MELKGSCVVELAIDSEPAEDSDLDTRNVPTPFGQKELPATVLALLSFKITF